MNRFFSWCRRSYLRIHFVEPEACRPAQDAVAAAQNAACIAQQAMELYWSVARKLDQMQEEAHAYFCSSVEEDAQVAELKRMQNLLRRSGEDS